ncbi:MULTISPECIES: S1C family serine protease [Pontibacillus]|uniref:Trypsin-like peptidase domain-containing protein n=1 Tax=Pontibacillus chungwhensis TaxID=265426 RepID=A0ABY8V0E8_9BACI|nr:MULTISPECIES: trypsin-like peptidase domain-containing protein [Pontibacillus]MCD5325643.1 trypsin-like peptidase domain-containing protein [Pontibacillus sp. HN14]WIF98110.1 trypsin-like peptidase domain-containing protein [Pontibacillus chungwhensis]
MGYYDDQTPSGNQHKRPGWIMPTVVGIILGAVLIMLALPALIQSNLLPYDLSSQENKQVQADEGESNNTTTENVNLDVTTQVTEVVSDVQEAVVGVVKIRESSGLFQEQPSGGEAGTGSGVIYKKENGKAYIVTNNHVVQGADRVEVSLIDGTRIEAELVGADPYTDLAVLTVEDSKVDKVIEIGDSSHVKVGEPAIAIGSPLGLMFSGSVTKGIISGKQRAIPQDFNGDGRMDWQAEVMQTDAAINPGNSGGALINIKGQLIGINSMKIAKSAVEGIGFAIPINNAVPIMEDIEEDGEVTRPFMGIGAVSLSEVPRSQQREILGLPKEVDGGVVVDNVQTASPADQAGLQQYDVITQLDGKDIQSIVDLRKHLYKDKNVGDKMSVTFFRNGQQQEVTMTLSNQSY